jgi:hypothetical protein
VALGCSERGEPGTQTSKAPGDNGSEVAGAASSAARPGREGVDESARERGSARGRLFQPGALERQLEADLADLRGDFAADERPERASSSRPYQPWTDGGELEEGEYTPDQAAAETGFDGFKTPSLRVENPPAAATVREALAELDGRYDLGSADGIRTAAPQLLELAEQIRDAIGGDTRSDAALGNVAAGLETAAHLADRNPLAAMRQAREVLWGLTP